MTKPARALRIVDQGVHRLGQGGGIADDDPSIDTIFNEVVDSWKRHRDNRPATALGLGNRAVTPIGPWGREENDVHRRVEIGEGLVLIPGPVGPPCKSKILGLFFEVWLELAMANDHHVCRCPEPGCSIEEEPESAPFRELADCADDWSPGRYTETFSALGSVGRFEAILERNRQNGRRQPRCSMPENASEGGVGAQGSGETSIEITVVEIASDVTGVAKRADKRHHPVDARSHTQEVIVGKVADDDIALPGEGRHCLKI